MKSKEINAISLFSGIGAFEKALTNLKIPYRLIHYCEYDKAASKSYSLIHNMPETLNLWDITQVNEKELPKNIDLVTYGFPCQDISCAGNQKGLFNEDGSKTRSGLFFDALRIIKHVKPKIAIAENVKALTQKKFKKEFEMILSELDKAGYNSYHKVINAKDMNIPQKRQRVFIVSIRKDIDDGNFAFPNNLELKKYLHQYLEDNVDEKYYLSGLKQYFFKRSLLMEEKGNGFRFKLLQKENAKLAATLTTHNGSRMDDNFIIDQTLVEDVDSIIINKNCPIGISEKDIENYRIRRLTPIECFLIMGFSREDCILLQNNGVSDTILYKQTGNSIVVDVIMQIMNNTLKYF